MKTVTLKQRVILQAAINRSIIPATRGPWAPRRPASVFAHNRARIPARTALAAVAAVLLLGWCAPGALADTTTTINFDLSGVVPGTTSPMAGDALGDQYEAQGVVFGAFPNGGVIPNSCAGSATTSPPLVYPGPVFYRDTANARSQRQVAYSNCAAPNLENSATYAEIEGQLTSFSDEVSVYAGEPDGGPQITLQGYDVNGDPIAGAMDTATVGVQAETLLSISTTSAEIAYFTVTGSTPSAAAVNDPLEIDDLSFDVPPTPPPAQLQLAGVNNISGYESQTVSLPVTIQRFNGADGAVDLSVSGLPAGVTLTGGSTIAAGSDTTDLTFAIAANAPVANARFTITATSSGVSAPPPVQGTFSVSAPFAIGLANSPNPTTPPASSMTVTAAPCSSTTNVFVDGNAGVPGTLTISSQGDTAGLTVSLNGSAVGPGYSQTLTVTSDAPGSGSATYTITLSGEGVAPVAATLIVNRVAPEVASVSPTYVLTPQSLHPGTSVSIEGSGFCPDSQVSFGNTEPGASATPSYVSPDGSEITVAVPTLATDGPVTISTAGETASSYQKLEVDSYRNVNGYQFRNYVPNISFNQMTEAFGAGQTLWNISFNPCWPVDCTITLATIENPFAVLLQDIAQNTIGNHNGGGACFGFSLSTQRFLMGQESLFEFPNNNNNTIFGLDSPSGPSPGPMTDYINALAVQQFSSEFLQHYLVEVASHAGLIGPLASQSVYNEIHDILAEGRFPMVSLNDGGWGHVMIAYNVEGAPPGNWYIDVYDSNRPFGFTADGAADGDENATDGALHQTQFDASRIMVGASGGWQFSDKPGSSKTGDMTKLVVTDPAILPEDPTMLTNPFALVDVLFGSAGAADTPGTSGAAAPPSTVTQVSDASDHTLFDANGNLNTNPATRLVGTPFAPLIGATAPAAGANSTTPPMILLASHAPTLHATVTDTGSGSDTHTFIGQDFAAQIATRAVAGAVDNLTIDPNGGAGFATNAATKPESLTLIGATGQDLHTAQITSTGSKGASDMLSFTGSRSGLSFVHHGRATTFSLTLSAQGSGGLPAAFESGPLPIGANTTARIGSIQWASLNGSALQVTIGGHTLTVQNRVSPTQLASITSLTAKQLPRRTVSLTIRAALHDASAGTQLGFGWVVQRSGHVVATHALLAPTGTQTASFNFTAKHAGRYKLTATVTVLTDGGLTQSAVRTSRTLAFSVPASS